MSQNGALVQGGKTVLARGGWATKQLLRALNEGRPLSSSELKDLDTLRAREWEFLDEQLIAAGNDRLVGIADLISAGLVTTVPNALGKTMLQYEKVSDMDPASISLSGRSVETGSEKDGLGFDLASLPLPIIHKDFDLDIRTLSASRERGESLDVTQARVAGRLVSEALENMLFNGGPTFVGAPIYGYLTHPDRNEIDFATAGEGWTAAGKTGEEILSDVLRMIEAAEADRFFGPYWLYIPGGYRTAIGADFKTNSDKSILSRISEVDGIRAIRVADKLPANNVVLVNATDDVVKLMDGEGLQSVQWDQGSGFVVNFKAWQIAVPRIASDSEGRSGVVHMHAL